MIVSTAVTVSVALIVIVLNYVVIVMNVINASIAIIAMNVQIALKFFTIMIMKIFDCSFSIKQK